MRVIGLAGWSGAGKTTLLTKLIPCLKGRGLAVSTLKHGHHRFDVDHPGKDSYKHREAGAMEVLIASGRRWALMHEIGGEEEPGLPFLLRKMSTVDLIVIEGFKEYDHPKIEVHRTANEKPFLFPQLTNVLALATDAEAPKTDIPVLALDDIPGIADAVLKIAAPLDIVLDRLDRQPKPASLKAKTVSE